MNIVFSRIAYPEENRIQLVIEAPEELEVSAYAYCGEYDPIIASQANPQWHLISSTRIVEGINRIQIDIPWHLAELIGYPTNFAKVFDGKAYNVYHFIHINRLRDLYSITGIDIFRTYADKWEQYTKEWPEMEIYHGFEHAAHTTK